MNTTTFEISYPPLHIGADKTQITFYDADSFISAKSSSKNEDESATGKIYVTDKTVAQLPTVQKLLSSVTANDIIVTLEAGETHKTMDSVLHIIAKALDANMQRSSVFIGIGGGVICDMTAFAASIFKRGACLELIPTTLLAMVDAAIGGKTGCDFANYKNMVGTFYPAKTIHIASEFVQSLSEEEFSSGLAEVVKTAMLYDAELFDMMIDNKNDILQRNPSFIEKIIYKCAVAKARIVKEDLSEKNIRMQLNLGHTFAHALETLAGLGVVSHGHAVAWGIGRAIQLSLNLGYCDEAYYHRVFSVLDSYGWCTKAIHPALQNTAQDAIAPALLHAMKNDKKNSGKQVRIILQKDLNSTVIEPICDDAILQVLC
ncbi:MAG: 3-dehydroquinate synthase family protein [Spirochaetales bacterium]